ncbi:MAG: P-type conjugative transfer protein TrbG [Desulfomonilia bacterium]|jgi:type IV secretion system protein VirB9
MKKCIVIVLISLFVISACAQNEKIVPARQVKAPTQKGSTFDIPVADPVPQANYKKVASPQLKKLEAKASKKKNEDPAKVIDEANKEAAQKPTEDRYINAVTVYDYMEGALYEIYSAPFHVTDIMLQPGETLTSPPAAGDTARWSLDVTTSGTGKDQRVHIFLKPHIPNLHTNIAVSTDKHIYHLECQSFNETYQAGVSWYYPKDQLASITNRINAVNDTKMDIIANLKISDLNFNYSIKGSASWKPLRAFDDGKKVFIQFPADIEQGELPPLFIVTKESDSQLVNYRYQKHYYIVDRLFDKALLQLGTSSPEKVYIYRNSANEFSLGGL